MRILALDASTDVCAVALGAAGHWRERAEKAGQRHSEMLLPMVRALLDDASLDLRDLDGIAFGAGPGSFTGLRIACGVAQGLAFGADLPVVPVVTLEAMAEASGAEKVVACLDARMEEVYHAAYVRAGDDWDCVSEPGVYGRGALPQCEGDEWCGVGNGFAVYPELSQRQRLRMLLPDCMPTARAIGILALPRLASGNALAAEQAAPLYVRSKVALTTAERAARA